MKKFHWSKDYERVKENWHSENHFETIITLKNIGNAWGDLGDYEIQRDLLTQALEIFEKYYGKVHPYTKRLNIHLNTSSGSWIDHWNQKDFSTISYSLLAFCQNQSIYPSIGTGLTKSTISSCAGVLILRISTQEIHTFQNLHSYELLL